jgi:hypothetical protein
MGKKIILSIGDFNIYNNKIPYVFKILLCIMEQLRKVEFA